MVLGKKQIKKIIYFQIVMVMCMNAFITMFNVPGTIMYILDITCLLYTSPSPRDRG